MKTIRSYYLSAILLSAILIVWTGCVPPKVPEVYSELTIDYRDTLFQRIHKYQDQRLADSLYGYLKHPNPSYRYLAAMAFGSLRDSAAVDSLALLLADDFDEVRAAAAYAMGQTAARRALPLLTAAFVATDTAGAYAKTNRAILEAVGKCGDDTTLSLLAGISTYRTADTLLLEGQAWGIYRLGLRGITSAEGQQRMIDWAAEATFPRQARLPAVHYLGRIGQTIDSLQAIRLVRALENEDNRQLRMGLVLALGKAKSGEALSALRRQYERESDYRVKINILRALGGHPYEQCRETAQQALRDPNLHIARRAATYFVEHGKPEDATLYWRFAKDSLPTLVQLDLYRAANKHLPRYFSDYRDFINSEIRNHYNRASDPVVKAAALHALSEFGWNMRFIHAQVQASQDRYLRSQAMEALAYISNYPGFDAFFTLNARRVRRELAAYFSQGIGSGDEGLVSIAANALRHPTFDYSFAFDSLTVLEQTLSKLALPQNIEAYNDLSHTLAQLTGKADSFQAKVIDYNHPPNWAILTKLKKNPTARISTSKGELVIELWPAQAPATVISFIEQARRGYYKGKKFHRVVPNFVIQGGCPRGDGYGSLNYSLRSELPDVYYHEDGILGMASAGNDTEGVQFFITHSPAPHLDGRYTAFGRVLEGMEIVHNIQVGDIIRSISIQ